MADITMCDGVENEVKGDKVKPAKDGRACPLKDTCYRHKAIPNPHWQATFIPIPYDFDMEGCEHYIKQ